MNNLIQNILAAKHEGWEQLVILVIIVGFAILKKIITAIKNYAEQQSQQQGEKDYTPSARPNYIYDKDAFKTIEQIRDEKVAKIRARYGIPEPVQPIEEAPMEFEPEYVEPAIESPRVEPPPAYVPPVYHPKKKKQTCVDVEPAQHPAYSQQQVTAPSVPHAKKSKQHEQAKPTYDNILVRLSTPQDLRTAILYQEILGKPLALRD